jgi:hypothetical protein
MRKILSLSLVASVLAGCAAETSRTLPVLVWDDKPIGELIYRERAPLVIPPNYKDPVLQDWNKNNFTGQPRKEVQNVPLPPPRPFNLTKPHCDIFKDKDCRTSK